MCRAHTHLPSHTGTALPAAPEDIAALPASQRRVRGLIDAIVGRARKNGTDTSNRIAGWLEEAARKLRRSE